MRYTLCFLSILLAMPAIAAPAPLAPTVAPSVAAPVVSKPVDQVASSAASVNPFTGKELSLDLLNTAAQAEKLRSAVIDEKLKQTEQLAKIECLKNPHSRYCGGQGGSGMGGGSGQADAFAYPPSAPPMRSNSSSRHATNAPSTGSKMSKKPKTVANGKPPITAPKIATLAPSVTPATFGPRVVGVVQQNGSAAVMFEQNGQVMTAKAGEMVGGRQVGAITRCSVELGGVPVSVCNEVGQTPITSTLQAASGSKANSPLLQGPQTSLAATGNDTFLAAPPPPPPNGVQPVIPAPLGSTSYTAALPPSRS
ncbi:hypothetical protein HA052_05010 [Chromobacterium haemolyticum]|uniref:Type IV pilus biogenesis protein PilP n=1 Tax=Chromobacterium fluminis TaxID=3044269 RepID=A0ABX0L4Q7_9NEIS|nr:hypothetical protein [Chromobacterium haemolyticum]NHR04551.1 hypothetical protein [Chromobacterium haemolyticum]